MNTLKSLTHALAATLLPIMLFSFGALMSTYQVLGSPDPLKQALSESGVYDEVISQALKSAQDKAASDVSEAVPVSDPGVQAVIDQAIPADTIKTQVEKAIDGTYNWAQGKNDKLAFDINFGADTKAKIADGLADYASTRLDSLPTCAAGQTGGIDNPLTATCLPAGIDKTTIVDKVRSDVATNPEFLKDATIDASTTKTDDGQTIAQRLHKIPAIYQQVRLGLYITGALAVACAVAVIFCAGTVRTGLKRVAIISIVVGAVSAVLAWGAGFGLHQLANNPRLELGDNPELQKSIIKAIEIFTNQIRNWWVVYGLTLAGLGVGTLVALRLTRPGNSNLTDITDTPVDRIQAQKPIAQKLAERQTPGSNPAVSQNRTPATNQGTPMMPGAPSMPRADAPRQGGQSSSRPGYRPGKKIQ